MAKKPDLQPGEYGIKIGYASSRGKRYLWVSEKFSSIEDAEEYLDFEDFDNDNCTDVAIVDYTGEIVGGFCY